MARAMACRSASPLMRTSLAWTLSMASRPARSGNSTGMRRSKRPGRSRAGSRLSGRLVAARDDDALGRVEAVHLGEQLVESLLALVVAAYRAVVALFAYGVYLVDKDDAGGLFRRLLEEVAHLGCAHADEHLNEFAAGYRERRARAPRRPRRGPAASCRCPEGPRAARPWADARRCRRISSGRGGNRRSP